MVGVYKQLMDVRRRPFTLGRRRTTSQRLTPTARCAPCRPTDADRRATVWHALYIFQLLTDSY